MTVTSLRAAATLRDKETYERMDVLWSALVADPAAQEALLRVWRRQVWGMATAEDLRGVQPMVPDMWHDVLLHTVPNVVVLGRWEAAHGYTNRS